MNASAIPYRTFGIPMQRRSARRRLVVVTYLALTTICGLTFWFTAQGTSWNFTWMIYATMAVGIFIFGGQGRYGLVKSFYSKPPRPEPPVIAQLRLQISPLSVGTPDESSWKNDERELSLRDRAHYTAYQPLCFGFMIVLLLGAWALHPPRWASQQVILQGLLLVGIVGAVLSLTLPSAIILWNEPDMMAELEEVSR